MERPSQAVLSISQHGLGRPCHINQHGLGRPCHINQHGLGRPCHINQHGLGRPCHTNQHGLGRPCHINQHGLGRPCHINQHGLGRPCHTNQHGLGRPCHIKYGRATYITSGSVEFLPMTTIPAGLIVNPRARSCSTSYPIVVPAGIRTHLSIMARRILA